MIVVCAWCRREMGETAPHDDDRVTHGICSECAAEIEAEAEAEQQAEELAP